MTKYPFFSRCLITTAILAGISCSADNGGESDKSSIDGGAVTTDDDTNTPADSDLASGTDDTDSASGTDDDETGSSPQDSAVDSDPDSSPDSETGTDTGPDSESEGMITFNTWFGGDQNEQAYSVLQTTDGGYLVSGRTSSFLNDPVEVTDEDFIMTTNDILLGKFSPRGELEWKKNYGDRHQQKATSMIVAPDGGYLLAGESTASFGTAILNIDGKDIEFDKVRENAHMLKVDDDGNEDWSFIYGETYTIEGFVKVILTQDNHYLAVGYQVRFDEDYEDEIMAPSPMPDNCQMMHYVVKTDLDGTVVWEKAFNSATSTWNLLNDVVEGPSGYMVVGASLDMAAQGRDFFVAELEKDTGDVSWEKLHPGRKRFTGDDYANTILPIRNQAAEITGYLIAGGHDFGYDYIRREIWGMIRLVKIDLAGNMIGEWFWDITGVNDPENGYLKEGVDEGLDLVQTDDGKFVLLATVAFDVFIKYYEECDVYLMKIDENGQVEWERRYGTEKKYDMPAEIAVTEDGGFIIVGSTQSFLEPDAVKLDDWHLIKTDPQGEIE